MAKILNYNDLLETSITGPYDKAVTNTLYGINYSHSSPPIPAENYGRSFVFFTRPMLNLTDMNLLNAREMYPLMNKNPFSMERFVRTTLDPRLQWKLTGKYTGLTNSAGASIFDNQTLDSPLCDKYQGFIPLLTNTLLSLSGIPDIVVPHMTTSAGVRREQYAMVDGMHEVNDVYEVTATFRNIKTGVLPFLFQNWVLYESLVFEGTIVPYIDFILENEIDYNTRFYILVMDKTGKYVSQIFAPGSSFPISIPLGKYFDFNRNEAIKESNKTLDIRFVCSGGMYNDPILKHEFNMAQCIFNPYLRKYYIEGETWHMVEIDDFMLKYFNYRAYPLIDIETNRLKWLLPKDSKKLKRLVSEGYIDSDKVYDYDIE